MTSLPPDDERKLVNFLKQYRPSPPQPHGKLEQRLMQQIQPIPHTSKYSAYFRWFIASAIAACGLLGWGAYRWFNSSPQIAFTSESNQPAAKTVPPGALDGVLASRAVTSAELETFLVESWTGAMGYTVSEADNQSSELDWYTLVYSSTNEY